MTKKGARSLHGAAFPDIPPGRPGFTAQKADFHQEKGSRLQKGWNALCSPLPSNEEVALSRARAACAGVGAKKEDLG